MSQPTGGKLRRSVWTSWRREAEPSRKARRNRAIRGYDTWETETRRLDAVRDRKLRRRFGGGSWSDHQRRVRARQRWRVRRERRDRVRRAAHFLRWRLAAAAGLVVAGLAVWTLSGVAGAFLVLAGAGVGVSAVSREATRQRRRYRW